MVGGRLGLGIPEAEVGQGPAGLSVDVAIAVIVEVDADGGVVDVWGEARRDDGRRSFVTGRQGPRKVALAVECPWARSASSPG